MKKIFALAFFAALNLNLMATDIWGNNDIWNNNKENNESADNSNRSLFSNEPIFGNYTLFRATRPGGWEPDEGIGQNEKDPAIPVGEGLLVLLIGGGIYASTKLRRKE